MATQKLPSATRRVEPKVPLPHVYDALMRELGAELRKATAAADAAAKATALYFPSSS